jgi:hypothetical protein
VLGNRGISDQHQFRVESKWQDRAGYASSEALGDVCCRKPCICRAGKQGLDPAGVNTGIAPYYGQENRDVSFCRSGGAICTHVISLFFLTQISEA